VNASPSLSDEQRALILQRLPQYIDSEGLLRLISSETPSQWRNRQEVIARFCALLAQSLRVQRRRVATHPSRAARERRLALKRAHSQRKAGRGRISPDDE
jgi:ribosome-associated protein